MDPITKFLLIMFVINIFASVIEAAILARIRFYDWKEAGVSLISVFLKFLTVNLTIATPLFMFAWNHRIATIQLTSWPSWFAFFMAQEFIYYVYHRMIHRVRLFWCSHAVHHSPNDLNFSVAYRSGVFVKTLAYPLFYFPLVWAGFPIPIVAASFSINLLFQFWVHSDWFPRIGFLEYIFNTPSAHRVHHATNPEYKSGNYGGVLIIFDLLFGTYVKENKDIRPVYGLVPPVKSYNPITIEFCEWVPMIKDIKKAQNLKTILRILFMPPTSDSLRPDENRQINLEINPEREK